MHRDDHPSVSSIMAETSPPDKPRDLKQLEQVIERGVQTFVEVGVALMEVRDRKLYEEAGYVSFEMYCYGRWGFKKSRAYQLMEAAQVAKALGDGDSTIVERDDNSVSTMVESLNERQARAIAPLVKKDPEAARKVLRDVSSQNQHVTASRLRAAVEEHFSQDDDSDNVERPLRPVPKPVHEMTVSELGIQPDYSLLERSKEELFFDRLYRIMVEARGFSPEDVADIVSDATGDVAVNNAPRFASWINDFVVALEYRRRPGVRAVK